MRPIPVRAEWVPEGATRRVFAPPDGDLTNPEIATIEAVMDSVELMGMACERASIPLELEGDELAALVAGGRLWLSFVGHVPVFQVTVSE